MQISLDIFLMMQCFLQIRMLKNTVLVVVMLPIDNATVQEKMFENSNTLQEMTLRKIIT